MEEDEELAVWTNIVSEVSGVFFGYTLAAAGVKYVFGVFQGIAYTDFVFIGAFLAALDAAIRTYQFHYQGKPFERYRSETHLIPDDMTLETFKNHVWRTAYAGVQLFVIILILYIVAMAFGSGTAPGNLPTALITLPYGTIAAMAIFLAFAVFYARFQNFPVGKELADLAHVGSDTDAVSETAEPDDTAGEESDTAEDDDTEEDADTSDDASGDDSANADTTSAEDDETADDTADDDAEENAG